MRFAAYAPIWIASAFLFAQEMPGVPSVGPQLLQGGILAVLGWTIYYVLVKVFPAHEKAQKDQRDAFFKFLSERDSEK